MPPSTTQTITITSEVCLESNQARNLRLGEEERVAAVERKSYFGGFETKLKWLNIISITIFHLLTAYWMYNFPVTNWKLIIFSTILGEIGGFGVTACAHRFYTHRSFKANLPLQIILLFCYTMAGQNTLPQWVRDHRVHHKFSETNADPHNSNRGFFFAHVGWLMMEKHPEVLRKGKSVDCSDVINDPLVRFHTKYFIILKIIVCFLIPFWTPILLWDEKYSFALAAVSIRYCLNLNFTWMVNSIAHIWGYRPYDKTINPVESWIVSIFAMGEGWHNYHHTFPWDYRAAEIGKFLNITTLVLDLFAKIGWAYDLKTTSQELVKKIAIKSGDESHPLWGHQEVPKPRN